MRLKQIGVIVLVVVSLSRAFAINAQQHTQDSKQNLKQHGSGSFSPQAMQNIKRYWLSADTLDAVQAELQQRNIQLSAPLRMPSQNHSLSFEGLGPSGYNSRFLVEQVGTKWHLYVLRNRPQLPVAPFPYIAQEVIFDTTHPEVSPVGTLTYPEQGGPFPAVVLVAGTGAHQRDGNISLHKSMLVLADHLTRQGFAVLRYDKRGVGLTGGAAHPLSTTEDYAADALAALRFLKIQPQVNARKVGIVGHSEGGIIAAMVAAQAPGEVAFVTLLATPGLPGIQLKSVQDAAARRADGMPEALVVANQRQERELFEIAASSLAKDQAMAAMVAATKALPEPTKTLLQIPTDGFPGEAFESLLTPWFRQFLQLDPAAYLQKVQCPVLVLNGDYDLQVPATENTPALVKSLAKNQQAKLVLLPGHNHLLQQAKTGREYEYLLIEHTMEPAALQQVSEWMQQTVTPIKMAGL